jgi:ribosomal protein S18 acetylase RimI-like enzyme
MPLIVRRVKIADIPTLEQFESDNMKRFPARAGWMEAYRRVVEKSLSEEPEGILVAEYEGRAIGCAVVRAREHHPVTGLKYGQLMTLTIAQGWRGQGIDTRLLREAEAYLRSRGCESISLTLPADAGEDADLFKTSGYRVLGWELERTLKS